MAGEVFAHLPAEAEKEITVSRSTQRQIDFEAESKTKELTPLGGVLRSGNFWGGVVLGVATVVAAMITANAMLADRDAEKPEPREPLPNFSIFDATPQ